MEHDKNDEEEQELQDFQDVLSVTILQNQQDKTVKDIGHHEIY